MPPRLLTLQSQQSTIPLSTPSKTPLRTPGRLNPGARTRSKARLDGIREETGDSLYDDLEGDSEGEEEEEEDREERRIANEAVTFVENLIHTLQGHRDARDGLLRRFLEVTGHVKYQYGIYKPNRAILTEQYFKTNFEGLLTELESLAGQIKAYRNIFH